MDDGLTIDSKRQLFNEHKTYIYRTALLLTHSESLADDIVQETFIRIFKKYHSYNQQKPFKPWIYKIALNVTRNILRKNKWLLFVGQIPEKTDPKTIEDQNENEVHLELQKEINQLTVKSREVIILHFYNGFTLKEISEIANIPLGTCKSRLNTGLNRLRKRLKENDLFQAFAGRDNIETL